MVRQKEEPPPDSQFEDLMTRICALQQLPPSDQKIKAKELLEKGHQKLEVQRDQSKEIAHIAGNTKKQRCFFQHSWLNEFELCKVVTNVELFYMPDPCWHWSCRNDFTRWLSVEK